jgi:hypothetical protein
VKDQTYPRADTKAQWFEDNYPGAVMDANCGVIHTTETIGWPGYEGGATAPNLTGRPVMAEKRIAWRQHFPIDRSSRALRNTAGGVQTNTLNVAQVELVGSCDPKHKDTWKVGSRTLRAGVDYVYWPDAPDWALRDLGHLLAWCQSEHGIPATSPIRGRWTPYPESYGPGGQRLSNDAWRGLSGWVGHQHVPENLHGDPGALNFPRAVMWATEYLKPTAKKPAAKKASAVVQIPAATLTALADGGDMFQPMFVRVKGKSAVYVVTLAGARHVKNQTEKRFLEQGGVTRTVEVTATELAQLLEKE